MRFRQRRDALTLTAGDVLALHGIEFEPVGGGRAFVRCPAPDHEDRNPSCTVDLDGRRFRCFGCGARGDLVDLHRLLGGPASPLAALEDLERLDGAPRPAPVIGRRRRRSTGRSASLYPGTPVVVRRWRYFEVDGDPSFDVLRVEYAAPDGTRVVDPESGKPKKSFRVTHPNSNVGGLPERYAGDGKRPLYCLAEILFADACETVYVVEGERAADALRLIGLTATTSSGGSNAPRKTDWSPLAGRDVLLWRDNDEAGERYAEAVEEILASLSPPPRVERIDIERLNLPPGGDAADWIRLTRKTHPLPDCLQPHRGPMPRRT